MAYNRVSPRNPYIYESPEKVAEERLRTEKKIADVTQRADAGARQYQALQGLAAGVDPRTGNRVAQPIDKDTLARILPPGGMHPNMSAADIQAATDRINQHRATQQANAPQAATPKAGVIPQTTPVNGVPFLTAPIAPPTGTSISGSATPGPPKVGDTRKSATGGTETLMGSESGPRWVASINNPPPINGQGAPTMGKPWTPEAPATVTTPQQAAGIAMRYGDPTGGYLTAPGQASGPGYAGTGPGAPPYIAPSIVAGANAPAPVATVPAPVKTPLPTLDTSVPPVAPVSSPSRAALINPVTPPSPVANTPPAPTPPPVTSNPAQPAQPTTAAPVNDDEEERRRRMASASQSPASSGGQSASQPYQFS